VSFGLSSDEVGAIVEASRADSDEGRALRTVLRLLVEANMQEADEDGSDSEYERRARAEASLFALATAQTRGARWAAEESA